LALEKDTSTPITVNGGSIRVRGKTRLKVKIGDIEKEVSFLVIEQMIVDALVGTDFLNAIGALIDFRAKEIILENGEKIPLLLKGVKKHFEPIPVMAKKNVRVPARSITYIPVNWSPWKPEDQDEILCVLKAPSIVLPYSTLWIRNGFVNPVKGEVKMQIINPLSRPARIYKGQQVAQISLLSSEVVNAVMDAPTQEITKEELLKQIDEMDLSKDSNLTEFQQRRAKEFLKKNVEVFARNPKNPRELRLSNIT
jgi:hypothetical protein